MYFAESLTHSHENLIMVISMNNFYKRICSLNLALLVNRTSRSEFIVSLNKYLESQNHKLSVGMRFKMRFEGEEVPERR